MAKRTEVEFAVIDNATAAINKVAREFNGLQTSIERFVSATQKIVIGGAIVGGAIEGIRRMTDEGIKYGTSIEEMAKKTGLTTDQVQEFSYMAQQSGASMENMTRSFRTISTAAYDAYNGNKKSSEQFKQLGVSVKDASGNLRDVNSIFKDTLIAISSIENPTERAAVAQKIFGKAAGEVMAIVGQGPEKLRALTDRFESLGLKLDGGTIAALHNTELKLKEMHMSMQAVSGYVALTFVPGLNLIAESAVKAAKALAVMFGAVRENPISDKKNYEMMKGQMQSLATGMAASMRAGSNDVIFVDFNGKQRAISMGDAARLLASTRQFVQDIEKSLHPTTTATATDLTSGTGKEKNHVDAYKKHLDAYKKHLEEMQRLRDDDASWTILKQAEADRELEKMQSDYEKNQLENEKKGKEDLRKIEEEKKQIRRAESEVAQQCGNILVDVLTLIKDNNRQNVEVQKETSTAIAVVQGAEAAVKAWNAGWDVGVSYDKPAFAAGYLALSLATTAVQIAAIQAVSYERGGIVGGKSYTGDRVPARVNSGEMILNQSQQSNLFNMANGKTGNAGGSEIHIHVSDHTGGLVETLRTRIRSHEADLLISDIRRLVGK